MLQTTESNERDQDLLMNVGLVVRFWACFDVDPRPLIFRLEWLRYCLLSGSGLVIQRAAYFRVTDQLRGTNLSVFPWDITSYLGLIYRQKKPYAMQEINIDRGSEANIKAKFGKV